MRPRPEPPPDPLRREPARSGRDLDRLPHEHHPAAGLEHPVHLVRRRREGALHERLLRDHQVGEVIRIWNVRGIAPVHRDPRAVQSGGVECLAGRLHAGRVVVHDVDVQLGAPGKLKGEAARGRAEDEAVALADAGLIEDGLGGGLVQGRVGLARELRLPRGGLRGGRRLAVAEAVDAPGVGADQQPVLGHRQAPRGALDGRPPHLPPRLGVERQHLALPARQHQLRRGDDDVQVFCLLPPEGGGLAVRLVLLLILLQLLELLFHVLRFRLHEGRAALRELPLQPRGGGIGRAVQGNDLIPAEQVCPVRGDDHLPPLREPGDADVARPLVVAVHRLAARVQLGAREHCPRAAQGAVGPPAVTLLVQVAARRAFEGGGQGAARGRKQVVLICQQVALGGEAVLPRVPVAYRVVEPHRGAVLGAHRVQVDALAGEDAAGEVGRVVVDEDARAHRPAGDHPTAAQEPLIGGPRRHLPD